MTWPSLPPGVRSMSFDETVAMLDADDRWRRYQVAWPEDSEGCVAIEHFIIARDDVRRLRFIRDEGPARDPGSGTFRRLIEHVVPDEGQPGKKLWMSDSRAEILEHKPVLDAIWWSESEPGDVLINGCGLGVVAAAAARSPGVTHVDVVEINPDVATLLARHLPADKVTIHVADAFAISWPKGKTWKIAWHDIWSNINDLNLPEMDTLQRKYGPRVSWQVSWQREGCRNMARTIAAAQAGTLDPKVASAILDGERGLITGPS